MENNARTNPVVALIGGLIIGLLVGGIGIYKWTIAQVEQGVHEVQPKVEALAQREAIYKAQTIWARDQFKTYADSIEKFGYFTEVDKKTTVKQYREHVTMLQNEIDQAERIR